MDFMVIIQMIVAAVVAAVLYTIIGVAPGTDETAVLAPITLAIVLLGVHPAVILCFFISAIVAKKLTDSIPVAVAGIPGGVMAAPMVEHAVVLKAHGRPDLSMRKMASGSVIGTLVAVPVSLFLASALVPLAPVIKVYANQLFLFGAVFLALMAREKVVSLLSIIPFALLIQGLRHLYWGIEAVPKTTTVFVSFFLGITIGPMIVNILELFVSSKRKDLLRHSYKEITMREDAKVKGFPNPFKILDKKEIASSTLGSLIGCVTFFMSPVGMTIFLGETLASRIKDPIQKAARAISTMDALTNATYVSGTLIPLIALGVPLSPMAIGPANALFNAPPRFTLDKNLHHVMSTGDYILPVILGAAVALAITYPVTIKYSTKICKFVFRLISHEALLGMFFGLVVMLAYMEAGFINIWGVMLVALVAGTINRWGVNYGVQFMTLYCAAYLSKLIVF
ncbi:MAG: tripartite tricarboxylate transporter permease [Peptococcaceae bacterium]|jgi:hypothetical protein|nr:tripartite tricarboxylate transporter permease [Peptococcaceae bacterium]MDH7524261.1 tripartite tricarboxylate transporter permease [Peptococcaceae bacterium]